MGSPDVLTFGRQDFNTVKYIDNTRVYIDSPFRRGKASTTGYHEAAHSVVALKKDIFKKASVEPDSSARSLGHVITAKPDIAVAMAAKSRGCSGTSHDERVAAYLGNPDSGRAEADKLLDGEEEELNAFGCELDKRGKINEGQAVEIYSNIKSPEVVIYIDNPGQRGRVERKQATKGVLEIPAEWVPSTRQ